MAMRIASTLVSLVASLASFATGASASDELPAEGERRREPARQIESGGFQASGPRFYVWDEDPRHARAWAEALRRSDEP
jgi:hypothetical protein